MRESARELNRDQNRRRRTPMVNYSRNDVKNPGRREFLKKAGMVALVLGVGATAGFGILEAGKRDIPSRKLTGKPVEGEVEKTFITDELPDQVGIPLRSEFNRSDDSIICWTTSGHIVEGRAYYGPTYPTQDSLGHSVESDNRTYGWWYEITGVPFYDKTEDGKLVPRLDENEQQIYGTAKVAGNFLTREGLPESANAGQ
jgi:hypothetical protein